MVRELPSPGYSKGKLARSPTGVLAPAEVARRRRNRRWFTFVALTGLLAGVLALALAIGASREARRTVPPLFVPAGYKAVSDGVFAYAVPATWVEANAYTDDVGDLDTQGSTGWVGEHLGVRSSPPAPGEVAPQSFMAFGEPKPTPFTLGPPSLTTVPGATVAYRYVLTRPGGFTATAIDAWRSGTDTELWILVHASPSITAQILATLRAG